MLQKFIVHCSLFIVFAFFASPAFAQTSQASTPGVGFDSPGVFQTLPPTVSPVSPLYTDLLIHNMFHTFSCIAIGQSIIGQPCLTYQMTQNAQGMLQGVPVLSQVNTSGGALGVTSSLIGALYTNPPVRTADYLASVGQGLGIVKTANAQVTGSGAAVLSPILQLWQVSRNISYVIMIIIFLIIGLMVMFRNKINPQTVITAQAALPGLVIGLIMITFSFFFAGLISDMAFVGTNVVGYYFSAVRGDTNQPQDLVKDASQKNILSLFGNFVGIVDHDKAAKVASIIYNNVGPDGQGAISWLTSFLATQFMAPIANGAGQTVTQIAQFLAKSGKYNIIGYVLEPFLDIGTFLAGKLNPTATLSALLALIATLALVYQMIMLLIKLLNSYLTIIFLTITAPFQFLFAALPGRQGAATGWMLNMLANILVFPAVIAVLYFVAFLLGQSFVDNCAKLDPNNKCVFKISQANSIRIVDSATFPLFGGLNLDLVQLLLAFGALMALPAVPGIIIQNVGKAGQAGQMIGQEISSGIGQGQKYFGQGQGAFSSSFTNVKGSIFGEQQRSPLTGKMVVTRWGLKQGINPPDFKKE